VSEGDKEKRVLDVNALAIFLVKDHPGNMFVSPVVEEGLKGAYIPILMDVLPFRAYWIMTKRWGCQQTESAKAIEHFVTAYDRARYVGFQKETIVESFRLAEKLKHDVFDCAYLAFALQETAKGIVTTDTDFERICRQVGLEYINPVPKNVLKRFAEQNR
jgi:predicted nucleic acid-binding protein